REVDVVVVGASLAGLAAADDLHRAGFSVAVLEEWSLSPTTKFGIDLPETTPLSVLQGPHVVSSWVNTEIQPEVSWLVKKFDLDVIKQQSTGVGLRQNKDGAVEVAEFEFVERDQYKDVYSVLASTIRPAAFSNNGEVGISPANYLGTLNHGPDARFLDGVTFAALVKANFSSEDVEAAADLLCAVIMDARADAVSALYVLEHIKSCGGLKGVLSVAKHGCHYQRLPGGAVRLASCLASQLPDGVVHCFKPVISITQKESEQICLTETVSGDVWVSRRVILAIPTAQYHAISFDPPLPPSKEILVSATRTIPSAGIAKISLVYDTPWWREAGLSGSMESVRGPIMFTREGRVTVPERDEKYQEVSGKTSRELFVIDCYIDSQAGRERPFEDLSAQEKESQMLAQLADVFGAKFDSSTIPQPVEISPRLWDGMQGKAAKEIWEGYHLSALALPPGILTASGSHEDLGKLGEPFAHVYFVGAEFATEWRGLAEGALRSGIRGAREVMASLCEKGQ
ncbi:hypothetical protein V8F20_001288, partial [Naviculisporaceae sp. PSN 640]